MASKYGFFVKLILDAVNPDVPLYPLESVYDFAKRKNLAGSNRKTCSEKIWQMQRSGYLKIVRKNSQKFIKLTKKGQLQKLLVMASVVRQKTWDGKWRLLIFDIPENSHEKRDHFRWLLKRNNFIKLQASVFVSPYALNRQAIEYLRETGLSKYIKILKVEEMDDDREIRDKFGLIHSRP